MAGTVTVACMLPHGLLLRLFRMVEAKEGGQGGFATIQKAELMGAPVKIGGYLKPNTSALIIPSQAPSFAFTDGIDKEFMTEWLKQNAGHDAVISGLIAAFDKRADAEAYARQFKGLKSGFEPMDPANLPKGIQTGTTKAA